MYNEIIYHLDLSIMTYHYFSQSLIWPWDPFYEVAGNVGGSSRDDFMADVRTRFMTGARGATLNNNACPKELDPILCDYSRINPAKSSLYRPGPGTKWALFQPIPDIVDKIVDGRTVTAGTVNPITYNKANPTGNETDHIYFIEGRLGMTQSKPAQFQKDIVGFILERQYDPGDATKYDIHIAFRGSRSGAAGRAMMQGLWSKGGNPSWVTDMQVNNLVADAEISRIGKTPFGFSSAVKSAATNIYACLAAIHARRGNNAPRRIYSTGHSLGGGMAGLFGLMINTKWDANNVSPVTGPALPGLLSPAWAEPIKKINVITHSAPVLGDWDFVNYYNYKINCKRVKVQWDPVTADNKDSKLMYGLHAGALVQTPTNTRLKNPFDNHEFINLRNGLLRMFGAQNIPAELPYITYDNFGLLETANLYNTQKCQIAAGVAAAYNDLSGYLNIYAGIIKNQKPSGDLTPTKVSNRFVYISTIMANAEFGNLNTAGYDINRVNFKNVFLPNPPNNFPTNDIIDNIYCAAIFTQICNGVDLNFAAGNNFPNGLQNNI